MSNPRIHLTTLLGRLRAKSTEGREGERAGLEGREESAER